VDVILTQKIRNLGDLGDTVKVANGFGRNFLLPQKKAIRATKTNLAQFQERRAEYEKVLDEQLKAANARQLKITELTICIAARASDEGKLFGSIGTREVADAVTAAGSALQKSEVRLPLGPIRDTGEHEVTLQLHSDVMFAITISVVAQD
jgi:large subunit ribosomal protein L9